LDASVVSSWHLCGTREGEEEKHLTMETIQAVLSQYFKSHD